MLVADRQARRGLMAPWAIGMNAKEYRAAVGMKPVGGIFSVGIEEPYRWKDSVQSAAEIRLWVADLVANGMRPWFTKFARHAARRRWLEPVEEIYHLVPRRRALPAQRAPARPRGARLFAADRVVLRGRPRPRPGRGSHASAGTRRSSRRASRSRWSTTACSTPSTSSRFKTLILPNIAALSDAPVRAARAFRGAGRQPRRHARDLALRRVGRRSAATSAWPSSSASRSRAAATAPMQNSYLRLEHEHGAAATRCSSGSRTRRGSSTAPGSSR